MLASGYVPTATATVYTAPEGGIWIGSLTMVNEDTGTDFCNVNIFIVPRNGDAVSIIPKNEYLGAEGLILEDTPRFLKEGTEIRMDCTHGSNVKFTINPLR